METQDENCEVASESSISSSGGEGHEGDDELTDWAPSIDNSSSMEQGPWNEDSREIRAGIVFKMFKFILDLIKVTIYFFHFVFGNNLFQR